jgi:HEAT repeat protein
VRDERYFRCFFTLVAVAALCSCQSRQRPETTASLIDDLQHSPQVRKQAAAAQRLGERKATEAVPHLIRALKDPAVQTSAARALGVIKDPRAVGPLIELLADFSPAVRAASARALGNLKDSTAVLPLAASLKAGNEEAGPALAQIGESAIGPLIDCLREPTSRYAAIDALIVLGQPAVPALVQSIHSSDSEDMRVAIARVLAETNDSRAGDSLHTVLKDGNLRLAAASYKFLLRNRTAENDALLVGALREYGRIDMAQALAASGDPELRGAAQHWADVNHFPTEMLESKVATAPSR